MIGLEIRFLAGRFHANAWQHAHNEGVSEWPPSPWRVLRALASAVFDLGIEPSSTLSLFEKLRGLPRYRLPSAREGHTRHYMPDVDDRNHKRSKVFDTFVAVDGGARDPGPVTMVWPQDLEPSERDLLARLAARVTYLGRAESWSEAAVVDVMGDEFDAWPDESAPATASTVLMTLEREAAFREWAQAQPQPKKGKLGPPRTLWDVLTFSGERYRAEGWTRVPGTRLSRYVFARPPFRGRPDTTFSAGASSGERPTVATYAIRSAVLPRLTEALSVGERLRTALMARSVGGEDGLPGVVFSGHSADPLDHAHAFYLPGADVRGRIDHFVVSARMGFGQREVEALQKLHRVWGRDGHDLELVLTGLWTERDAQELSDGASPVLGVSRVWESLTPFVPPRHPKERRGIQVDSVPDQIRAACRSLLGVEPVDVSEIKEPRHYQSWARYRRCRRDGGGSRGPDRAWGARLVFAEPVRGPIALGFGAHFGLGVFVPAGSGAW